MKVLATTGYYGSGSSAVTDLMKEYDGVKSKSEFEISFFFGYHGILHLYNWLIRWKRLQREAVEDFLCDAKKEAKFGRKMNYEKYFNNRFMEYTYEYVKTLRGLELGN